VHRASRAPFSPGGATPLKDQYHAHGAASLLTNGPAKRIGNGGLAMRIGTLLPPDGTRSGASGGRTSGFGIARSSAACRRRLRVADLPRTGCVPENATDREPCRDRQAGVQAVSAARATGLAGAVRSQAHHHDGHGAPRASPGDLAKRGYGPSRPTGPDCLGTAVAQHEHLGALGAVQQDVDWQALGGFELAARRQMRAERRVHGQLLRCFGRDRRVVVAIAVT
jgi:hypothetical protein